MQPKRKKKRKRDNLEIIDSNEKWLSNFKKKKPKKLKSLDKEIRDRHIMEIFRNLNNIKDIINIYENRDTNTNYIWLFFVIFRI